MRWHHLDHFQLVSRAKFILAAEAQKKLCPQDEMAGPAGKKVFALKDIGSIEGFVSFRTRWGVQPSPLRFAPDRASPLFLRVVRGQCRHREAFWSKMVRVGSSSSTCPLL